MPENRARQTIAASNGIATDRIFGAVAPPLYLSSTFAFAGFEQPNDYDYLRHPFRFPGGVDDGRSPAFMSALEAPTRAAERPPLVKVFGCRQAYENRPSTNPRAGGDGLWGFGDLPVRGDGDAGAAEGSARTW
jgi:cystathionine beta-lyase/cystathionine gamma-synthase